MTEWTRDHDRVLAEKCEGITIFTGIPVYEEVEGGLLVKSVEKLGDADYLDNRSVAISRYNLNIADAIRAAEAWVEKDLKNRFYEINRRWSCHNKSKFFVAFSQSLPDDLICWIGESDDVAEAVAFALYKAVK